MLNEAERNPPDGGDHLFHHWPFYLWLLHLHGMNVDLQECQCGWECLLKGWDVYFSWIVVDTLWHGRDVSSNSMSSPELNYIPSFTKWPKILFYDTSSTHHPKPGSMHFLEGEFKFLLLGDPINRTQIKMHNYLWFLDYKYKYNSYFSIYWLFIPIIANWVLKWILSLFGIINITEEHLLKCFLTF